MRDQFAVESGDIGKIIGPEAASRLRFTVTKLVTEDVDFGPAGPGDPILTPGQLLDLQLMELATSDGTPHEITIEFGEEMWAGTAAFFRDFHADDGTFKIRNAYGAPIARPTKKSVSR